MGVFIVILSVVITWVICIVFSCIFLYQDVKTYNLLKEQYNGISDQTPEGRFERNLISSQMKELDQPIGKYILVLTSSLLIIVIFCTVTFVK